MRTTTLVGSTILAVALAACGTGGKETAVVSDDFGRDLQLASATTMNLATPAVNPALLTLENGSTGAPERAPVVQRAESERAVEPEAPAAEVAQEEAPAPAPAQEAEPVVTAPAPAPTPESSEPVAVAPRPTAPAPAPVGGAGAGDYGRGGGVFGGGIGVVIRGGGVHGDNCQIHRRGGGVIFTNPVYTPRGVGTTSSGVRPMTAGSRIVRK